MRNSIFLSLAILCQLSHFKVTGQIESDELMMLDRIEQSHSDSIDLESMKTTALIEKLEFRTETDEWDLGQQRYSFRWSFADFASNDYSREQFRLQLANLSLLEKRSLESLIYDRYRDVISVYYLQAQLELIQLSSDLLADRVKILEYKIAQSESSDLASLYKLRNEVDELGLDSIKINLELQSTWNRLEVLASNEIPVLSKSGWWSIDELHKFVVQLRTIDVGSTKETIQSNQLAIVENEIRQEENESKKVLDFVQLNYAEKNSLSLARELSLGLGINIPTKNTNLRKRNELALEKLEEEYELRSVLEEKRKELNEIQSELNLLISEYQAYAQYAETQKKIAENADLNMAEFPHLIARMELRDIEIQIKKDILKREELILESYVKYLLAKGLIYESPRTNFLNKRCRLMQRFD